MSLKRQTVDLPTFESLIKDSEIIVQRKKWPKVIRKGGDYFKFFNYGNKGFRRRHINPVATEFVRNAHRISQLDIKTINPHFWARCPKESYDVVGYKSIPGRTVYSAFKQDQDLNLLTQLAQYIAELHSKNFYFRHGHSDNYLTQEDGSFAIIDIDNVRFSMNPRRVAKNLFYLINHAERNNRDLFLRYGTLNFVKHYFKASGASPKEQSAITSDLRNYGLILNE